MTLKELMGDLERGDGRRFTLDVFAGWFEPIFLSAETWHGKDQAGYVLSFVECSDGWKEYAEPKKKIEMWLWASKNISGEWFPSLGFLTEGPSPEWVKIEGSKIEVEE